jgi:hypothetical protein
LFLAAALICAVAAGAVAEDGIGMVLSLEGTASALRKGVDVPLDVRSRVYESDVVNVWMGSKLQILLDDETSVTLGPDSTLDLVEFSEEAGEEKFESRLSEGSMRIITGETTERNPDGFKITTRHAAVAIRGTVLSLMTNDDFTRVDVESAKRAVLVNMREISEFDRITIRTDGTEEITRLSAGERAGDLRLSGAARPNLAHISVASALAGSDAQGGSIPLGAALPAAPKAYEMSEPVAPQPEPSAPEPIVPETPAPEPDPVTPEPEPVTPEPEPVTPEPEPVTPEPEPVTPEPEPVAPEPEPVAPEPEPVTPEPEPVWPPYVPPDPQTPSLAIASGTVYSDSGLANGMFSFTVNLDNGVIKDGAIDASGRTIDDISSYNASLSGGNGQAFPEGFTVENFSGTITVNTTNTYSDAGSKLEGPGINLFTGTAVEGRYEIRVDDSVMNNLIDEGYFDGELKQQ